MPKQIIIAEQHRIAAVFSEDRIEELVVATGTQQVGDVYMGVVENILVSIDAAFVNIGDGERNGFIHVTDLGPLRLRRSNGAIGELLNPQQRVLVQVMKEPTGNKGPRLTGNITLPGRYVVLMPFGRGVNLSRRITSEAERNRLRALGILIKPSGMGLLVRTEAEGVSEEAIVEDLDSLQRQWEGIQQEAANTRQPMLLNRDRDFIQRVLRDLYTSEVNRIVTDSADGVRRVKQHLLNWGEGKIPPNVSLDHHRERVPLLEYFRVNAAIREALKPRVDLPSGGYVVIQPTEALTVIDVNSGSFTKSQTSRETVLWTNCEAATEVARQIRLRNIAGVIVVDFIDMESRRDRLHLLEHFNKALQADKSRPQIAQLTELGLVELTRKRQGQSLYELFGCPCPTCSGLGLLTRLPGEAALAPVMQQWEPELQPKFDPIDAGELTVLAGGMEANLVNHPSYQERSASRRRRRSGTTRDRELGDSLKPFAPGETRESRRGGRAESRTTLPGPERQDRSLPRLLPLPQEKSAAPVVSVVTDVVSAVPAAAGPTVSVVPERERPARREREAPRMRAQEPPEVITVEMTAEEQEIYAHLGISPLVLSDREVKDPRNTIVAVALPGQAASLDPQALLAELRPQRRDRDETSDPTDAEDMETMEREPTAVARSRDEGSSILAVEPPPLTPAGTLETPGEADLQEPIVQASPAASRRRRRAAAR